MSIYATMWRLKFPSHGDDYTGCGWIEVIAQGVPAHIGAPTPGFANAIPGLANAMHTESPVISIAGSADLRDLGRGAQQEIDQVVEYIYSL